MMGLIETCSVWEINNKYKELSQTEYMVLVQVNCNLYFTSFVRSYKNLHFYIEF